MKTLIRFTIAGLLLTTVNNSANAQFGDILKKAKSVVTTNTGNGNNSGGSYTNTEAVSALKEALKIGSENSAKRLASMNGYFGNQVIKIIMPPEVRKVENTLRSIGMGDQVDKAILSMNRAAEDAAMRSVPIFVDAITGMSIQDGISIVRGGDGSATNYLKSRTTQSLTNAYRPIIQSSLNKVNATKYWADVFTIYNRLPTTRNKVNTDLVAYVTERALNGLFVTITDEENKIRRNPASRVTDLLRKVFGGR